MPAAALAAVLYLAPAAGAGQAPPPASAPAPDIPFPEFELRELSNGAELLVVSHHEQPHVTVNLVIRGGTAADPARQAGLAAMTAELLTKGVQGQLASQVAEDVDMLGAQLGAIAGPDYTTVSLSSVTESLDDALGIMADVVTRPAFPADELARQVARARSALNIQEQAPTFLASRAFTRSLYGEHPYGKIQTAESLGRIDVQAVTRYHRDYYRPNNAVFVVAGDVTADAAAAALDAHFGDWEAAPVSLPTFHGLPQRSTPDVVLVHVAGAADAVVRVGQAVMPGEDPDWTALRVANRLLGEGTSSRLGAGPGAEGGIAPGASSGLIRRGDAGYFQARAEVRAEVVDSAVAALIAEVDRLRTAAPAAGELAGVQSYLIGSFPLAIETPQQIANQVTTYILLGLERDALETYRERIESLTAEDVRAAAERQLQPDRMVIVVAGDALQLHDRLARFGSVTVENAEGLQVALEDLRPRDREWALDASALRPGSWTYDVQAQDWPVGKLRRRLTPGDEPGTMTLVSEASIGPREVHREVTFRAATFEAVRSEDRLKIQGREMVSALQLAGDRVTGSFRGPGGQQSVEGTAVVGAVLGEMTEMALWVADLEATGEIVIPVVQPDGSVTNWTMKMQGPREVTVPAGVFDTYQVEVDGGGQRQRIYVRAEEPRYTVKIEVVGQPVVTLLTDVTEGSPER
jgi:zinc protease